MCMENMYCTCTVHCIAYFLCVGCEKEKELKLVNEIATNCSPKINGVDNEFDLLTESRVRF